jgi:hypothetical protein
MFIAGAPLTASISTITQNAQSFGRMCGNLLHVLAIKDYICYGSSPSRGQTSLYKLLLQHWPLLCEEPGVGNRRKGTRPGIIADALFPFGLTREIKIKRRPRSLILCRQQRKISKVSYGWERRGTTSSLFKENAHEIAILGQPVTKKMPTESREPNRRRKCLQGTAEWEVERDIPGKFGGMRKT